MEYHRTNPSEPDDALREALEERQPRFFRVEEGSVKGTTGVEDAEGFADDLSTMQRSSMEFGEILEMSAITYVMVYIGESMTGYCHDQESDPREPRLIGSRVNTRLPMRSLLKHMNEFRVRNPAHE